MIKQPITQAELQHIEHCNKALEEHLELVTKVTNEVDGIFNTYLPILTSYVNVIKDIQQGFGAATVNIVQSAREMKVMTSGTNELQNYIQAILKLDSILNDELIQKIIKVTK